MNDSQTFDAKTLLLPSNIYHKIMPTTEIVDLVYIEPSLLDKPPSTDKSLDHWLEILPTLIPKEQDLRITHALKVIHANLGEKITQHMVAREAGLSTSQFAKLFRQNTGLPLRRYVLWKRLNVAVMAIAAGNTFTFSAHAAGFSDSAHFSRTVRAMFGVSPRQGLQHVKMNIF